MPKPVPEAPAEGHALETELSVMQDIAVALSQLDAPTRARVLQWIAERFRDSMPVAAQAAARPGAASGHSESAARQPVVDEGLSVSALEEFFDPMVAAAVTEPALVNAAVVNPAAVAPKQSVPGMLHDFVAEFQDVAREWNAVCDDPADGPQRASKAT